MAYIPHTCLCQLVVARYLENVEQVTVCIPLDVVTMAHVVVYEWLSVRSKEFYSSCCLYWESSGMEAAWISELGKVWSPE